MIRKLRWKFTLINMALVGLVLVLVFSIIWLINYQQQKSASYTAMQIALGREAGTPPERFIFGKGLYQVKSVGLLPVFSIFLDSKGTIFYIDTGNVSVSEEIVISATTLALDQNAGAGVIAPLNLRYLREDKSFGVQIAFLDRSVEQAYMRNLLILLLSVGVGGLTAFFFISLFLSNWALRPVEKAWIQQRQFIADASHELKTPLTVILANLSILRAHPLETVASQDKWIDNTSAEAVRMKKLVEDLLYLARSDTGEQQLTWLPFSASDALWNTLLPFEPVAFENGVTISSKIAADVEMVGNETQIKQVFAILLDNACKYAGKNGSVDVVLEKTQDRLFVSVHNTGEPIPPEHIPHVFERFYRSDKARARSQGGYGLGLAIAAQITAAHRGQIMVKSNEYEGTLFALMLPTHPQRSLAHMIRHKA